eukprot:885497-Amphidinium_carterae.1
MPQFLPSFEPCVRYVSPPQLAIPTLHTPPIPPSPENCPKSRRLEEYVWGFASSPFGHTFFRRLRNQGFGGM